MLLDLIKNQAVFYKHYIIHNKIKDNILSKTSCEQFVARVIGIRNLTGEDKGDIYPDDVFNIVKKQGIIYDYSDQYRK